VKYVIPAEGPAWNIEANALIKKEHIKPAAKTFLDWAVSDKAMELYEPWRALTATGGRHPELIERLVDQDILWMAANRERILKWWLPRYGGKIAQSESE
jgi:iron(III) transport system substrate-binding protein